MLAKSVESTHAGWRCSLLMHVLCGQLAGLARHGADVEGCSIALCTEVCLRPVTWQICQHEAHSFPLYLEPSTQSLVICML